MILTISQKLGRNYYSVEREESYIFFIKDVSGNLMMADGFRG